MDKQDKISELFRDNAHKLAQRPSEATWSRIEQGLQAPRPIRKHHEQTRRQARHFNLRPLSIAAGLALLIGLSAAFLWVINEQDRQYQRALAATTRNLTVEDLALEEDELLPSPIVQKSAEKVYRIPAKTIDEGTSDQKLVARVDTRKPASLPTSPSPTDSADARQRTGR